MSLSDGTLAEAPSPRSGAADFQWTGATEMMDAVESIGTAGSEAEVAAHLTEFACAAGYEYWHIARASDGKVPLRTKKVKGVWPQAWLEQYDQQRLFSVDAISHACRARHHAFRWTDILITHDRSKEVMAIAGTDYGMPDGFCVPYFGLDGYQGAISFGGRGSPRSDCEKFSLEVVAIFAFKRLNELKAAMPTDYLLTPRQREVLTWIAAGKTTWDTSAILNVSHETVKSTVKSAMGRLNVHTRAQAIAVALRRNEIRP